MMICKNNSQTSVQPSALNQNTPKSNQHIVKSVSMSYEPNSFNKMSDMVSNQMNTIKQNINSINNQQMTEMKCLQNGCECNSYSSHNNELDSSVKQHTCLNCQHSWMLHGKFKFFFYFLIDNILKYLIILSKLYPSKNLYFHRSLTLKMTMY